MPEQATIDFKPLEDQHIDFQPLEDQRIDFKSLEDQHIDFQPLEASAPAAAAAAPAPTGNAEYDTPSTIPRFIAAPQDVEIPGWNELAQAGSQRVGYVPGPMDLPEPAASEDFRGPFTSGAVQTAAGKAAETGLSYGPPIFVARKFLPPESPVRQTAEAVITGGGKFAEALTSNENLALLAATGAADLPVVAGRAISAFFATQMAQQFPDLWRAFQEAPDFKSKVAIATQGVGNALVIGAAGTHVFSPLEPTLMPGGVPGMDVRPEAPLPPGGEFGLADVNVPGGTGEPGAAGVARVSEINQRLGQLEQVLGPRDASVTDKQGNVTGTEPNRGLLPEETDLLAERDQLAAQQAQAAAAPQAQAPAAAPEVAQADVTAPSPETPPPPASEAGPADLSAVASAKAEAPAAAPEVPPQTYNEAQARIESIEDDLEKRGVNTIKLVDPAYRNAQLLFEGGWQPMPPDLVEAYKARDAIGAGELTTSIGELQDALTKTGLSESEANSVLGNYGIKPGETDALAQNIAHSHATAELGKPLKEQAERAAYSLAAERGEMFDELKDISPKTLRDAANAVKAVNENLLGAGRNALPEAPAAEDAARAKAEAQYAQEAARTPLLPEAIKLRNRAFNEGGFINPEIFQDAAAFGRKVLGQGMDFARWSAHMIRQLGEGVRSVLTDIWRSLTGQNILPGARERGSVGGGPRLREVREELPTQENIERDANDPQKIRGHIETIQRMQDVSPDVKARVGGLYDQTTDVAVNAKANATINAAGLDAAERSFLGSTTNDVDSLALGHHVALRLDEQAQASTDPAMKEQLLDRAAIVRNSMAARLTDHAQSMWYVSTIGKTSPEGLIRTAQKLVDTLVKDKQQGAAAGVRRIVRELSALPDERRNATIPLLLRQLARVNKPGERLTAAQLSELMAKHERGELSPAELQRALNKYLKIPELTPANIAKIKAAQKAWADAKDPIVKQVRGADMMDSVYSMVPADWRDKLRATAVISMIWHGKLPIRIGVSNAIKLGSQMFVDAITNTFGDTDVTNVWDPAGVVVTGKEYAAAVRGAAAPLAAFRAGYRDAKLRDLGAWPSFREGMHAMLTMADMTTRGIYEVGDVTHRRYVYSSRLGKFFQDTVTLIHNVGPYGAWTAGFNASLARQMALARVDIPTARMIDNAHADGNRTIFYNKTAVNNLVNGVVRKGLDLPTQWIFKGKYGAGTATVPFVRVPSAVLTEGAAWTPLGLGKFLIELGRPIFTDDPFDSKQAADAIVKAAVGTGSLVMSGYQLYKLGVLRGAPDENRDLEAMRQASGWGKYSFNLSDFKRRWISWNWHTKSLTPAEGDVIYNYNWLEPLSFPIAFGASIAHGEEKGDLDLKRGKIVSPLANATLAGLQTITEHPMLQGVQRLMAAIGEGRIGQAGAQLVTNIPGNFIPSIVRQTMQYMDNVPRETRGGTGSPVLPLALDQEIARIEAEIPVLSKKYPAKYDVFGQAQERYQYGQNSLWNIFFDPQMINKFKTSPQLAEMERIYSTSGSGAALERVTPTTIMVNGKQTQLTNEQISDYQRYVGLVGPAMLTRFMASPAFAAEPLLMKQKTISAVLVAVNNAAKQQLFGQAPVTVNMGMYGPQVDVGLNPFSIAAMAKAAQLGVNQPLVGPPLIPRPLNQPVWRLQPPEGLPSIAP
jgi:hypothetical protein